MLYQNNKLTVLVTVIIGHFLSFSCMASSKDIALADIAKKEYRNYYYHVKERHTEMLIKYMHPEIIKMNGGIARFREALEKDSAKYSRATLRQIKDDAKVYKTVNGALVVLNYQLIKPLSLSELISDNGDFSGSVLAFYNKNGSHWYFVDYFGKKKYEILKKHIKGIPDHLPTVAGPKYIPRKNGISLLINGKTASEHRSLGLQMNVQKKYKKSLSHYEKSLVLNIKKFGEGGLDSINALARVGMALAYTDRTKAELVFKKAINLTNQYYGANSSLVADIFLNYSSLFRHLKDHEKSLSYAIKALNIYKHVYGVKHIKLASAHNMLGNIYANNKKLHQAIIHFKSQADIALNWKNVDNYRVFFALYNLGRSYERIQDLNRATKAYLKSMKYTRDKEFGSINPGFALSLARALQRLGKKEKAKALFRESLVYIRKMELVGNKQYKVIVKEYKTLFGEAY